MCPSGFLLHIDKYQTGHVQSPKLILFNSASESTCPASGPAGAGSMLEYNVLGGQRTWVDMPKHPQALGHRDLIWRAAVPWVAALLVQ